MPVNPSFPPRTDRAADDRLFLREEELLAGVEMLLAAGRGFAALLREPAALAGLNDTETVALLAIATEPGLDVATLRARLGLPLPTVARTLARLDGSGLVDRTLRDMRDTRRRALRLTPAGRARADALLRPLAQHLKAAYRDTGPADVAGTRRVLGALIATLRREEDA